MFSPAQALVIDRFKNPQFSGQIEHPDIIAKGENPFCGDEVTIMLRLNREEKVAEITHQCRACAVCTAATDLLAEQLLGEPLAKISEVTQEDIRALIGIPLSPLRLKCALLPLQALQLETKTDLG